MQNSKQGIRAPFLGRAYGTASEIPGDVPFQGAAPQSFTSQELFGKHNEVAILHRGERYSLRITGLGKLILTK